MKLRLLDYLKDVKEINGVSLSAKLQCTCGCSGFEFSHTVSLTGIEPVCLGAINP